ncbi:YgaB family protein [Geobacillus stearothermophilus]|uniref:YgaB family protein n=1 Tax=Geobacillus stearothermophilus TaxID=1422 RepID=UPI003D19AEE5
MVGHRWMNAEDEALFLRHEMERCDQLARELDELEREAPTSALREEVRRMKQQVEDIRRAFLGQMASRA